MFSLFFTFTVASTYRTRKCDVAVHCPSAVVSLLVSAAVYVDLGCAITSHWLQMLVFACIFVFINTYFVTFF